MGGGPENNKTKVETKNRIEKGKEHVDAAGLQKDYRDLTKLGNDGLLNLFKVKGKIKGNDAYFGKDGTYTLFTSKQLEKVLDEATISIYQVIEIYKGIKKYFLDIKTEALTAIVNNESNLYDKIRKNENTNKEKLNVPVKNRGMSFARNGLKNSTENFKKDIAHFREMEEQFGRVYEKMLREGETYLARKIISWETRVDVSSLSEKIVSTIDSNDIITIKTEGVADIIKTWKDLRELSKDLANFIFNKACEEAQGAISEYNTNDKQKAISNLLRLFISICTVDEPQPGKAEALINAVVVEGGGYVVIDSDDKLAFFSQLSQDFPDITFPNSISVGCGCICGANEDKLKGIFQKFSSIRIGVNNFGYEYITLEQIKLLNNLIAQDGKERDISMEDMIKIKDKVISSKDIEDILKVGKRLHWGMLSNVKEVTVKVADLYDDEFWDILRDNKCRPTIKVMPSTKDAAHIEFDLTAVNFLSSIKNEGYGIEVAASTCVFLMGGNEITEENFKKIYAFADSGFSKQEQNGAQQLTVRITGQRLDAKAINILFSQAEKGKVKIDLPADIDIHISTLSEYEKVADQWRQSKSNDIINGKYIKVLLSTPEDVNNFLLLREDDRCGAEFIVKKGITITNDQFFKINEIKSSGNNNKVKIDTNQAILELKLDLTKDYNLSLSHLISFSQDYKIIKLTITLGEEPEEALQQFLDILGKKLPSHEHGRPEVIIERINISHENIQCNDNSSTNGRDRLLSLSEMPGQKLVKRDASGMTLKIENRVPICVVLPEINSDLYAKILAMHVESKQFTDDAGKGKFKSTYNSAYDFIEYGMGSVPTRVTMSLLQFKCFLDSLSSSRSQEADAYYKAIEKIFACFLKPGETLLAALKSRNILNIEVSDKNKAQERGLDSLQYFEYKQEYRFSVDGIEAINVNDLDTLPSDAGDILCKDKKLRKITFTVKENWDARDFKKLYDLMIKIKKARNDINFCFDAAANNIYIPKKYLADKGNLGIIKSPIDEMENELFDDKGTRIIIVGEAENTTKVTRVSLHELKNINDLGISVEFNEGSWLFCNGDNTTKDDKDNMIICTFGKNNSEIKLTNCVDRGLFTQFDIGVLQNYRKDIPIEVRLEEATDKVIKLDKGNIEYYKKLFDVTKSHNGEKGGVALYGQFLVFDGAGLSKDEAKQFLELFINKDDGKNIKTPDCYIALQGFNFSEFNEEDFSALNFEHVSFSGCVLNPCMLKANNFYFANFYDKATYESLKQGGDETARKRVASYNKEACSAWQNKVYDALKMLKNIYGEKEVSSFTSIKTLLDTIKSNIDDKNNSILKSSNMLSALYQYIYCNLLELVTSLQEKLMTDASKLEQFQVLLNCVQYRYNLSGKSEVEKLLSETEKEGLVNEFKHSLKSLGDSIDNSLVELRSYKKDFSTGVKAIQFCDHIYRLLVEMKNVIATNDRQINTASILSYDYDACDERMAKINQRLESIDGEIIKVANGTKGKVNKMFDCLQKHSVTAVLLCQNVEKITTQFKGEMEGMVIEKIKEKIDEEEKRQFGLKSKIENLSRLTNIAHKLDTSKIKTNFKTRVDKLSNEKKTFFARMIRAIKDVFERVFKGIGIPIHKKESGGVIFTKVEQAVQDALEAEKQKPQGEKNEILCSSTKKITARLQTSSNLENKKHDKLKKTTPTIASQIEQIFEGTRQDFEKLTTNSRLSAAAKVA